MVYKQLLRQTEGFVRSLVKLTDVDIRVPSYSTFSRRGTGLTLPMRSRTTQDGPIHLVVDSTGLKIFSEGEWLQTKHKTKAKRKSWRKLHLGLDLVSGDIVSSDLTKDDVGDPTALPNLLDQIDAVHRRRCLPPATCSRTALVLASKSSSRLRRMRF